MSCEDTAPSEEATADECAICRVEPNDVRLECGHAGHLACLQRWFTETASREVRCPQCTLPLTIVSVAWRQYVCDALWWTLVLALTVLKLVHTLGERIGEADATELLLHGVVCVVWTGGDLWMLARGFHLMVPAVVAVRAILRPAEARGLYANYTEACGPLGGYRLSYVTSAQLVALWPTQDPLDWMPAGCGTVVSRANRCAGMTLDVLMVALPLLIYAVGRVRFTPHFRYSALNG